jgi:hypothetical protein
MSPNPLKALVLHPNTRGAAYRRARFLIADSACPSTLCRAQTKAVPALALSTSTMKCR